MIDTNVFRCLGCHSPLSLSDTPGSCPHCGRPVDVEEGIPVLVDDQAAIEAAIAQARAEGKQEWYDGLQDSYLTGPWRHHVRKRLNLLNSIVAQRYGNIRRQDMIALDLGCGDGFNGTWMRDWFPETIASDYNISRLPRALSAGSYAKVFMADVRNYPAQDNSIDFILFNHVLEHIPDDIGALKEVKRILKPGGCLILGVPNEGAWFWQTAYKLQPETLAQSDHVHFYTAKTLTAKCEEVGFDVEGVHPIGWGVPHWGWDARLRKHKFLDDLFEVLGKLFLPSQATSLYLLLTKQG